LWGFFTLEIAREKRAEKAWRREGDCKQTFSDENGARVRALFQQVKLILQQISAPRAIQQVSRGISPPHSGKFPALQARSGINNRTRSSPCAEFDVISRPREDR